MMKKKQLVKDALLHPELFTDADLAFFRRWLQEKKQHKKTAKIKKQEVNN